MYLLGLVEKDFSGFFRAYVENDDPDSALEGQEVLLPKLAMIFNS